MRDEDNGFVDLSDWLGQGPDQPEGAAVPEGTAEAEPEPEPEPAPVPTSDAKPAWVPESEPAAKSAPQLQGSAPKGKGLDRRRVLAVIVGIVALVTIAVANYVSSLYTSVEVGGRVSDYDTGLAVMGATVEVTAEDGQVVTATADRDGWWSVDVGRGDFEVSVSADDYEGTEDSFTVPVGEHGAPAHDFELHRQAHEVTGVVSNSSTGEPIADIWISFTSDEGYPDVDAQTGADGTYSVNLQGEHYSGQAAGDDAYLASIAIEVGGADTCDIKMAPIRYLVQGTVRSGDYDQPGDVLAGAQVFLYDSNNAFLAETTTGADGAYSFDLPYVGSHDYLVVSSHVSYTYFDSSWASVDRDDAVANEDLCLGELAETTHKAILMATDASTGQAIEGASVSVNGEFILATNSKGLMGWWHSGSSSSSVRITADGYQAQEMTVAFESGKVGHVEVALQPAG